MDVSSFSLVAVSRVLVLPAESGLELLGTRSLSFIPRCSPALATLARRIVMNAAMLCIYLGSSEVPTSMKKIQMKKAIKLKYSTNKLQGNAETPIGGGGVLLELVQAPDSVIKAYDAA